MFALSSAGKFKTQRAIYEMLYLIDSGNTYTKLARVEDQRLSFFARIPSDEIDSLENLPMKRNSEVFVATVAATRSGIGKALETHALKPVFFDSSFVLPFESEYDMNKLGQDRRALLSGATEAFLERPRLIVSAGTCITYDLLDAEKVHIGGRISPGLNMRYQALYNQTRGLPRVHPDIDTPLLGMDTDQSIRSGVQTGIIEEIEGTVRKLKKEFQDLVVILSGGDAAFFEKLLKVEIFADPLLLFKGLYEIYKLNARK